MRGSARRGLVGLLLLFGVGVGLGLGLRWWTAPGVSEAPPEAGLEVASPGVGAVEEEVVEVAAEEAAPGLSGRVRASGGEALEGVLVEVRGLDGEVVSRSESDAEGRFLVRLRGPVGSVRFARAGFAEVVLEGVQERVLEVELARGEGLQGRLTWEGEPVAGGRVQVGGAGLWPPRLAVSGADGRFVVEGLEAGRYEVLAQGPLEGAPRAALAEVDHALGAEPFEVPLEGARGGVVRVVDDVSGEPVSGALVIASAEVVRLVGVSRFTDERGEAPLGGLPWGQVTLQAQARGYEPRREVWGVGEAGVEEVRLRRAAVVRGVVRDAGGNPVALARLRAVVETPEGGLWEVTRDTTAPGGRWLGGGGGSVDFASVFGFVSEEDGRFEISGLPAGRVVVEARQDGLQPGRSEVLRLVSGAVEEGVELTLLPGYRLEGRVIGPDEAPVSGARVELEAPGEGPLASGGVLRPRLGAVVVTDSAGWFAADELPSVVEVRASAAGFEGASLRVELLGREEPVELRLSVPGDAVQGRVVDGEGVPVEGATLRHLPAKESEARRADACRALTHTGGRFLLTGCPDRPFALGVFGPDARWAPAFVTVSPGEEREIALPASGSLALEVARGEVEGEGGEEAAAGGASVRLAPVKLEGGPPVVALRELEVSGSADEAGLWSASGLAPGRWRLEVGQRGYVGWSGEVEVGATPMTQRVILEAARVVRGAVVDRYGAQVEAAFVEVCAGRTCARVRSDAEGRFEATLEAKGALEIRAAHPQVGRGAASGGGEEVVVELREVAVDLEQWGEALREAGLGLWRDGDAVVVEDAEGAAAAAGLRRGDLVLGVSPQGEGWSVEVVRGGGRRRFTLAGVDERQSTP